MELQLAVKKNDVNLCRRLACDKFDNIRGNTIDIMDNLESRKEIESEFYKLITISLNKKYHEISIILLTCEIFIMVRIDKNYIIKDTFWSIIKDLLKEGLNPNIKTIYDWKLLHLASIPGYTELVQILISHGADVEAEDNLGRTPLYFASRHGRTETVKILIEHDADVNAKDRWDQTPLLCASQKGHTEVVEILISHRAEVNVKDNTKWTPLHYASYKGHKKAVEILISNEADVNAKNNDGDTPLHLASSRGYTEIVGLLLEHGSDINIRDVRGLKPLHKAFYYAYTEVIKIILESGDEINDDDKTNHFEYSTEEKHIPVIKHLTLYNTHKKISIPNKYFEIYTNTIIIMRENMINKLKIIQLASLGIEILEFISSILLPYVDINSRISLIIKYI